MKKNWSGIILAAFFMLLASVASAQAPVKITGTVLESDTSQPIIQAAVQLLSPKDSSSIVGCVSENTGRFQLRARPGDYIVKVSCLGYNPQFLDIHVTPALDGTDLDVIRLSLDTELLEGAGLDSPFGEDCLRGVCEHANAWLNAFDLNGIA